MNCAGTWARRQAASAHARPADWLNRWVPLLHAVAHALCIALCTVVLWTGLDALRMAEDLCTLRLRLASVRLLMPPPACSALRVTCPLLTNSPVSSASAFANANANANANVRCYVLTFYLSAVASFHAFQTRSSVFYTVLFSPSLTYLFLPLLICISVRWVTSNFLNF